MKGVEGKQEDRKKKRKVGRKNEWMKRRKIKRKDGVKRKKRNNINKNRMEEK